MVNASDPFFPCTKAQPIPGERPPNMTQITYSGCTKLEKATFMAMQGVCSNQQLSIVKLLEDKDPLKAIAAAQWIAAIAKSIALATIAELAK